MPKTLLFILATASALLCRAQADDMDALLQDIEQNNTTLQALRHTAAARKLENHTGLTPDDPQVDYSYAWGSPTAIGNKQNVSVSQSFDMGTLSGLKGRVAGERDRLVEWQYRTDRMNILLEAKLCCLDLVYYNALLDQLATRLSHAQTIADGQKQRLDSGEGNRLEYNNALLSLSTLRSRIALMEAERQAVSLRLTRLNGGETVLFTRSSYAPVSMPLSFDEWYARAEAMNPALASTDQEIEVSRRELSLTRTLRLPTVSLGYEGEFETGGDRHQGIAVGMSVPLWSNKNRMRQARAAVRAAEARHHDARWQWRGNLETLFQRTAGLRDAAETYRTSLEECGNDLLLQKALDEGEISVLDYLVAIGLYYDAADRALEAERDYQKAYAELSAMEL